MIFSHGSVNNPIDYYLVLEALAANGYVVVAPEHTGNTSDDQRTNFINNQAGFALLGCLDGLAAPCLDNNAQTVAINRVNDIKAIIDTLPSLFGNHVMARVGLSATRLATHRRFLAGEAVRQHAASLSPHPAGE